MQRTILPVAACSASSLLLLDSAAKGAVLLLLALGVVVLLRRDSAATRHLVWCLALASVLLVPLLSAWLPEWRVLPAWLPPGPAPVTVASVAQPTTAGAALDNPVSVTELAPRNIALDARSPLPPVPAGMLERGPSTIAREAPSVQEARGNWLNALPALWVFGCGLLVLRLAAARWLLANRERQATALSSATPIGAPENVGDPLVAAFVAAYAQLRLRRGVTLYLHPEQAIPLVWGVLRYRLLLPESARQWSREQLRSVMLHELAHLKRGDTLAQWLAQLACAMHWFNPLVWWAAWRMHVERERACDDLVLSSGVRPSAYAEHLLHVASRLSPPRWTQAGGLAMARQSSLEGRLLAVLSANCNRRRVSVTLAAVMLALGLGVAVPVAMLRAAHEAIAETTGQEVGTKQPIQPSDQPASGRQADPPDGTGTAVKNRANQDEQGPLSSTTRTGTWSLPNGVKLEVKQELVHASDIASSAVLTWPQEVDGGTARYTIWLAGDAFANREPWQLAWEKGASELWLMVGEMQSSRDFHRVAPTPERLKRIDFSDPRQITETSWSFLPDELPAALRAEFATYFRPLRTTPPTPANAKPWVVHTRARDLRPLTELLRGDWQSQNDKLDVRLSIPEQAEGEITWTVEYERPQGRMSITALLSRVSDAPRADSVRLLMNYKEPPDASIRPAMLARLHRGIGDSLLLEFYDHARFPEYHNLPDVVLVRAGGPEANPQAKPEEQPKQNPPAAAEPVAPKSPADSTHYLFQKWQTFARADGHIPGGLIGELGRGVDHFVKMNPTHPKSRQYETLRPRCEASHDWAPQDAAALLGEVEAISGIPAGYVWEAAQQSAVHRGSPLPAELADAAWGEPAACGLRAAWRLEPPADAYPLGAKLQSRVLFHNSGAAPIVFMTETWHQYGAHQAHDANGDSIEVFCLERMGRRLRHFWRLAPGEYCEVEGHTLALGRHDDPKLGKAGTVGGWIEAKIGDEVRFQPASIHTGFEAWTLPSEVKSPADLWKSVIAERVAREGPMPAPAADRAEIVRRVTQDLTGELPTEEQLAAFVGDNSPDALAKLAARLYGNSQVELFAGQLPVAPLTFRVTAP